MSQGTPQNNGDSATQQIGGYPKESFENVLESFDCIICFNVSRNPIECLNCGQTYCQACQDSWKNESGSYFCLKCEGVRMQKLNQIVLEGYLNMTIRCSCKQKFLIKDFPEHEEFCKRPNCKFFAMCGKKAEPKFSQFSVCGSACQLFGYAQVTSTPKNLLYAQMMQILQKPVPTQQLLQQQQQQQLQQQQQQQQQKQIIQPSSANQVPPFPPTSQKSINNIMPPNPFSFPTNEKEIPIQYKSLEFSWDSRNEFRVSDMTISQGGKKAMLTDKQYIFKSVVADTPFEKGEHYFEIIMDESTQNEAKIGVVTNNSFNKNTAFCDTPIGYAYYSLGKLRNGSNANGNDYGVKFKNSGTCGVYLNMNKGILAFSYNGQNLGKAFDTKVLTQSPVFASVALLHQGGVELKSGLPLPMWTHVYR